MSYCNSEVPEQIDALTNALIDISHALMSAFFRKLDELDELRPAPDEVLPATSIAAAARD